MSEQSKGARDDQRQQSYGIKPDDVPVIAHDEGAQGVHDTEGGDGKISALEGYPEEQREEEARKTDLDAGDDIQELSESLGGDKYGEEVERARQIIGEQGDIVSTAAALPCPEQRAAVLQLIVVVYHERVVLVPQVGDEDLLVAEGRDTGYLEREEHQYERDEKR